MSWFGRGHMSQDDKPDPLIVLCQIPFPALSRAVSSPAGGAEVTPQETHFGRGTARWDPGGGGLALLGEGGHRMSVQRVGDSSGTLAMILTWFSRRSPAHGKVFGTG